MPDSWEGVLILLAVTAITLAADILRRRMPPPLDPDNYTKKGDHHHDECDHPSHKREEKSGLDPQPEGNIHTVKTEDRWPQEWDEGGGQEDSGA